MTVNVGSTIRDNVSGTVANSFASPMVVKIYTGAQPASNSAAATGTLLVSFNLYGGWTLTAGQGLRTMASTQAYPATASATGVPGWLRIGSTAGQGIDGTVGVAGSGADFIINVGTIISGASVTIMGLSITIPVS